MAQVDGNKVSPNLLFEGRDVPGISYAGGPSNSMYGRARQHGTVVT